MREQEIKQDNLKHYLVGIIVFILALAIGIFTFFFFVQETIEDNAEDAVVDTLEQQKSKFAAVFDVEMEFWSCIAEDISQSEDIFDEDNLTLLTSLSSGKRIERTAIISPEGEAVFDTGAKLDLSDQDYVKEALAGKSVLSAPVLSTVDNTSRIVFSLPIVNAGEIKGALCVSYDLEDLCDLIMENAYDGAGYFLLVTDDNQVLTFNRQQKQNVVSTDEDFFNYYAEKQFLTGSVEKLKQDFAEKNSGVLILSDQDYDEPKYFVYAPLENYQWMLCYAVPTDKVQSEYAFIKVYESRFVIGYIIAVLLLFIWVLLINDRRQKKLLRYASMDALTGGFNKVGTEEEITYWLKHHAKNDVQAFLMLDIDKFKDINDIYGHSAGDEVLHQVGTTLQNHFRGGDIIGRIGGDEFVVMMVNVGSKETAINRAKQLTDVFRQIQLPELDGQQITCSMGIAFAPEHGDSYVELYKCADAALYETKRNGRDGLTVYRK